EPEGRPLAEGAVEADTATVGLDDLTRDRETEAGAGDTARRSVGTEELGEDPRVVLGRDADSLVAHLDPRGGAVCPARDLDEPAVGRVLHCVSEQVAEHLGDPVAIGPDG